MYVLMYQHFLINIPDFFSKKKKLFYITKIMRGIYIKKKFGKKLYIKINQNINSQLAGPC